MLEKMLEETPTKVMSLLGVALASMVMLFMFTATDATFSGSQMSVADPFALDKVVSTIDYASAGYSNFLQANLILPVQDQYAMVSDNVSWIASNAQDGLYAMLGVPQQSDDQTQMAELPTAGQVAGAHTVRYGSRGVFDSVFSVFMQ